MQRGALWLSSVTAFGSIVAAIGLPNRRSSLVRAAKGAARTATGIVVVGALSALGPGIGRLPHKTIGESLNENATFFDFNQMPYPHQGPIDFDRVVLGAASIDGEQQRAIQVSHPGATLDVTLSWSRLPTIPLTATLAVVSPAEPRHGIDYAVAETAISVTRDTRARIQLPQDLARGLYLIRLNVDTPLGRLAPHTPKGRTMGDLFIGALQVREGAVLPDAAPTVARYTDLTLHAVEIRQDVPTNLDVRMSWSTEGTPRNWRLSLRLLDAAGRTIAQQDHQPGYGYLPTTLWHPGELVVDSAQIPILEGQAPGDYTLRIITYLQATGEGGGEYDVPVRLTTPTLYDIRDACCEQTRKGATILCQTPEMALLTVSGPETIEEGDDLTLEAEWNALLAPTEDLHAQWRVIAPNGAPVSEIEQSLAVGSRTSQWPRFTWVLSPVALDLPNQLDAGTYAIELSLLSGNAVAENCGAVAEVTVSPRPRVFEPPELPNPESAGFGDVIELLGYETIIDSQQQTLDLTVWWQAITPPAADLKRFIHLYDPSTEEIAAQDDAMPRDWTYPTSWWVAGEVISETISLDLSNVSEGSYRLGVGWYDPATTTHLHAVRSDGTPAPEDRVTLRQTIQLGDTTRRGWPWLRLLH
jgi:hypothetical protein